LRYARAAYVVRYRLTPDKVIVVSIWHGKENRPR
jgi:plasmid stabilization system protein ParE